MCVDSILDLSAFFFILYFKIASSPSPTLLYHLDLDHAFTVRTFRAAAHHDASRSGPSAVRCNGQCRMRRARMPGRRGAGDLAVARRGCRRPQVPLAVSVRTVQEGLSADSHAVYTCGS